MPEIHGSWLHALLRREPGRLPPWLLSSSGCEPDGIDIFAWLLSAVVAFLVFLALGSIDPKLRLTLAFTVFGAIVALILIPVERSRKAERKARARIRRGEVDS
jgi:hypothetical protein